MDVRFKNPPIDELVIGAHFDPPLTALRSEHIGLLWTKLRDEFPNIEQREPLGGPENQGMVPAVGGEFLVMPRFWFVSADETNLIQVQKSAILFNWRRRETEYPQFSARPKPSFERHFEIFTAFLHDDVGVNEPRIGRCELTYVNVIAPSDYWQGPQDTSRVIRSFWIPDAAPSEGASPTFNCLYRFKIMPHLNLDVAIRSAEAVKPPGSPRLMLELKAFGQPGGSTKSDTDAGFDQAHDAIVARFVGMIDEHVQLKN